MRRLNAVLLATAAMGFASGRTKPATDTTTPTADDTATTATDTAVASTTAKAERVAPVTTGVAAIDLSEFSTSRRGGQKSAYGLDKLDVGQVIGFNNKTADEIRGTVSNANRKGKVEMKDEAGKVINTVVERHYVIIDVTDAVREKIAGTPLEGSTVLVQRDK